MKTIPRHFQMNRRDDLLLFLSAETEHMILYQHLRQCTTTIELFLEHNQCYRYLCTYVCPLKRLIKTMIIIEELS